MRSSPWRHWSGLLHVHRPRRDLNTATAYSSRFPCFGPLVPGAAIWASRSDRRGFVRLFSGVPRGDNHHFLSAGCYAASTLDFANTLVVDLYPLRTLGAFSLGCESPDEGLTNR